MSDSLLTRISGHTFLVAGLGPDATVLDLGANRGAFARAVLERFGCRVHSVEPTPGLAAALALTGRPMDAEEALRHGVVSRVVPDDELDETALEIAHSIAKAPPFTVKMFRQTLSRMATPLVDRSMQEESIAQSMVFARVRRGRGSRRWRAA